MESSPLYFPFEQSVGDGFECGAKCLSRAVEQHFHRPFAASLKCGHLLERHVLKVAPAQSRLITQRQIGQGHAHQLGGLLLL